MAGENGWDIRKACRPSYVRYLREAVEMLKHQYPDVEVVESGEVLGPCFYRTVFSMSVSNPEDYKEVALAVARINEFVRDVRARLNGYGWEIFEKEAYESHVDKHVYMTVTWVKKIHVPGKQHTSVMDIYELALPYFESKPNGRTVTEVQ